MKTICPSCQSANRIPEERMHEHEHAKCGRCSSSLFNGQVINVTKDTIDKHLQDELPVIVDFWAPWCQPCINFSPVFESIATEKSKQFRFIKVNTQKETALANRFKIRSIPTIMIFHKEQLVDVLNGALPKPHFEQWLDEVFPQNSNEE